MNCPKCKSESTQALSVIFENGTHVSESKTKATGGGFLDVVPSFQARATTSSTAQSAAARNASPPEQRKITVPLVVGLLFLVFALGQISSGNISYLVTGLLLFAACCWWAYTLVRYNITEYPKLLDTWRSSWKCNQCGNVFQPEFQ